MSRRFILSLLGTFLLAALAVHASAPPREVLIDCVLRYVDTDHDGCVTAREIDHARSEYLNIIERMASTRTEKIMRDCDYNRDGCISRSDMEAANTTCVASEKDRNRFNDYICKRAAAKFSGER
jgi:hypothetical protein